MRNVKYDFLRSIGLIFVILAHVYAPNYMVQIRCFDVPLMVFVSGLVTKNNIDNVGSFFLKRVARLLLSVYLFITLLFLFYYLLAQLGVIQLMDNFPDVVINTYLLSTTKGLGYVWIFRVFLLLMIITPIIISLNIQKTKNYILFLLIIITLSFLNILFIKTEVCANSILLTELFRDVIQYVFGYGLIYLIAIRLKSSSEKEQKYHLFVIISLLFISLIVYLHTHDFPISIGKEYKYPPRWYFIIYGLFISVLLYVYLNKLPEFVTTNCFLCFLGQNTMWIYLWHIPFISVGEIVCKNWIYRWLFVLFMAILFYSIQYVVVKKYLKDSTFKKYLIG